jgi:hypothetical protein
MMVSDAAWGCDWIGTPVSFQRCLVFIIASANKGFTLTAGKFVPVSNNTMLNVRTQCTIFDELYSEYLDDRDTIRTVTNSKPTYGRNTNIYVYKDLYSVILFFRLYLHCNHAFSVIYIYSYYQKRTAIFWRTFLLIIQVEFS